MNRLAIFDCDGTLVDSGATIYAALVATFRQHGHAIPASRTARRGIGLSLDMAMAAAAGATPIGAGWGYHEAAELIEAGAVAVADAPLDVLDRIQEHAHG